MRNSSSWSEGKEYSTFRKKMIDLVLISNPDHRFMSIEKSAHKSRIDRNRSEISIPAYEHHPSMHSIHTSGMMIQPNESFSVSTVPHLTQLNSPKRVNLAQQRSKSNLSRS